MHRLKFLSVGMHRIKKGTLYEYAQYLFDAAKHTNYQ